MKTVGQILRSKRQKLGLLLRHVAAYVNIDPAILSKIERNERKPSKEMLHKFSEILKLDKEKLIIQFMSEKIAYEIADEDCASKVLKAAERKVKYLRSNQIKEKLCEH